MKRFAALLLLGFACAAWADETSHRRLAEELMGLTQTEATVRNWRKRFDAQAQDMVASTTEGRGPDRLSEGQMQTVQRFNERGSAALDEALAWNRLQEPIVRLYMQTFTEADTRELVAFYKTPVGQKMLTGLPALSDGIAAIVRNQVDGVRPRLQGISQDFQTEFAQASPRLAVRPTVVKPAVVADLSSSPAAREPAPHAAKKAATKPEAKKKPKYTSCKDPTRTFPHCSK